MPNVPTAEWASALDRMNASLGRALSDLDGYQTDWSALTDVPASATPPELLLAWLERRLDQWDARLTAAAELATSVEKQLEERESALGRWHDLFVRWRELIQQEIDPTNTSPGSLHSG